MRLLCLVLFVAAVTADFIAPGETIYKNVTLTATGSAGEYFDLFAVGNTSLHVAAVPCFGTFVWYAAVARNVTTTDFDQDFTYASVDSVKQIDLPPPPAPIDSLYMTLLAIGQSTFGSESAEFQLIASTDDPTTTVIPQPPSNGAVTGDVKAGTLKWTGTGKSTDTYSLYYYNGNVNDVSGNGYRYATACGIRRFMSPFTSEQGSFKSNGDGTYTADVNLKTNQLFTLTVVVDRAGGYSAAYNSFVFNGVCFTIPHLGASSLMGSSVMLVVLLISVMFM